MRGIAQERIEAGEVLDIDQATGAVRRARDLSAPAPLRNALFDVGRQDTATALAFRQNRKREEKVRFVAERLARSNTGGHANLDDLSPEVQRNLLGDARNAIDACEQWDGQHGGKL